MYYWYTVWDPAEVLNIFNKEFSITVSGTVKQYNPKKGQQWQKNEL